ncbi:hypothetical protein AcV7_009611, partial [Taiwanofungus camphoratus]
MPTEHRPEMKTQAQTASGRPRQLIVRVDAMLPCLRSGVSVPDPVGTLGSSHAPTLHNRFYSSEISKSSKIPYPTTQCSPPYRPSKGPKLLCTILFLPSTMTLDRLMSNRPDTSEPISFSSHAIMWSTAREIAEGDVVIIWLTRDLIQPLVITPGKELNSKFGVYRHSDLVGVPYGSKVGSRNGKGFIHVLRPTPELWTLALPHRTQILYLADIAFVISWLNIKPGSRVIEA